MIKYSRLAGQYGRVQARLEMSCDKSGRNRDEITLVAVSKLHPASVISELAACGNQDFGENYVQEAFAKRNELSGNRACDKIRWHMIGHVQSRKAAMVAGRFSLVHSLDSPRLADAMESSLAESGLTQDVLIEVNIGAENQKAGVVPNNLDDLVDHIIESCPRLHLKGLMCIPPRLAGAAESARPYFRLLRELREALQKRCGFLLPHLSMGMSSDFEVAVEEGATIVRVGTDIFGPRPKN